MGVRWFTLPWKQWTVVAAIIASTAAPVALAASADVWLTAEQDELTRLVVADASLTANGIDVTLEADFQPETVALADRQLTDEARSIERLGSVTRTVYTLPGLLGIAPEEPGEPTRTVGPAGRLFARDRALDNVTIVDQLDDIERGVWISTDFAERHDLALGDGLGFEAGAIADEQWNDIVQGGGASSIFRIVGTYVPLWSDAVNPDHQAYWAEVPQELIPRFLDAGFGPSSELVLTSEAAVLDSDLTGIVRWTAPLTDWPDTFAGLTSLEASINRFETQLVGSGPLAESMLGLATASQASPRLTTDITDTIRTAGTAADQLVAPLETARSIGTIVGLLAMAAVGIFFVERNRIGFRLLVSEGDGAMLLGLRVAAILAVPVAVGAIIGLFATSPMVRLAGPDRPPGLDGIDLPTTLGVAVIALLLVSATAAGWATSRTRPMAPSTGRALGAAVSAGVIGVAALMWFQIDRTGATDVATIDLAVVLLPLTVTAAALIIVLAVVSMVGQFTATRSERLPTLGFLTVSRIAASSVSLRITSLVLGLGIGLVVFAAAFMGTLDRAVDVKLASEIGGTARVQILDPLPGGTDLDRSTIVREFDTALTATGQRVLVLAINRDTYAAAVDWPAEFGGTVADAIRSLDAAPDDRVAAIAIAGQPIPDRSEFGLTQSFPFEVVARVRALPGSAAGRATLLVVGDDLDALGLQRAGFENLDETANTSYRPPTDRFRRVVITQQQLQPLLADIDVLGVRTRDATSQDDRRNTPEIVAARSAFGYLGLLGAVGATGATAALMASLAARRRQRALSAVLLRSMGFGPGRSATTTVLEVGGLVAAMSLTAAAAAPVTVGRVVGRFEPSPERPPPATLHVEWLQLAFGFSVVLASIGLLLWCVEWRAARQLPAEVLRER